MQLLKYLLSILPLSVSFDSVRVGESNQIFGRPDYGITKKTSIIPLSGKQLSLLFLPAQQLPRLSLPQLKGFLRFRAAQGPSTLPCTYSEW